jgi:ATP-binding cassette, subfamily F, member 3
LLAGFTRQQPPHRAPITANPKEQKNFNGSVAGCVPEMRTPCQVDYCGETMSLISANQLSKSFGPVDIFTRLSFSIPQRARIAIVGPNGIGKTTLLRILAGLDTPTSGQVHVARGLRLGYLPQESILESPLTLWEECLAVFQHLQDMEIELAELEQAMADPAQAEEALERYGSLQAKFDHLGGYTYPALIKQVLGGLGFQQDDYDMPLTHLSGGQRTRAVLAQLLLSGPDLLILDEPTNHLDIAAVEWLENYLSQWDGAVLIVSHDRYFLDRVCNGIWEMSRAGLESYRGNYSAYVQQRTERWELRRQQFETEIEKLAKELDYVRRNIAGQRVLQAKGKLRRASRMIQAIEQLGIDGVVGRNWSEISSEASTTTSPMGVEEAERRLRALRAPDNRTANLKLHLRARQRSGNLVIRTRDLQVGFPETPLFRTPDIELRRLECAALIGPNGAGKTTFLRTILGLLPPLAGEVILGASLEVGYFAQAHEGLQPDNTLMQEIESVAPHLLPGEIRDYLARFLFTGEDVFKPVHVLSGGERGRLALAKLTLSNANLLLLDEPTNHLDIPSQEALQAVLQDFQGTILLVSHDRYLINALASQVWEVEPGAGWLHVFDGTYSEYQAARFKPPQPQAEEAGNGRSARVEFEHKTRQRNRSQAEERRRLTRLREVEKHIASLEADLSYLTQQLESPPSDPAQVQVLGERYLEKQNTLESLLAEWEQLHQD